ncbi:FAD-dependent oxidoreductase [soil metagenome]
MNPAPLDRIVIVGASLAGVTAAKTLRTEGFRGTITMVGDEDHAPYDRPPLSKQVLTGAWETDRTVLPAGADAELDLTWELGVAAAGLDLAGREVRLTDGRCLPYDGLVIACGAAPRRIPGTEGLAGVFSLRTLDDAVGVRAHLETGARRVVVVGAGFIGAEVAASCRARGAEVTMVEPLPQPLARVLGEDMGRVIGEIHVEHGVDLRLGTGVERIDGGDEADGLTVHLSDGTSVEADLVVVGIGVVPNTGWLEGSGLRLDDGVVCDATTLAAPGVVAAGDVARWPNALFGEVMRVEHWEHAVDMGAHAARRLLASDEDAVAYAPVPWFWSDQYDRKLQLAGRVRPDDEVAVVAGSLEERKFAALYGRGGMVVGALALNMPARVVRYRQAIANGLTWADAMAALDPAAS